MSDYLYQAGSGLEVPGIEAVLEYGDASSYANGAIPGALRINDRSMPDQVHVTELTGLQDDPDITDSRTELAGRWGERAGILLPRGHTIGVTGYVRSNNVHRMRDLWRRMRAQFRRDELDLVVHPPGEVAGYVSQVNANYIAGWEGGPSPITPTISAFTDGFTTGVSASYAVTAAVSLFLRSVALVAWSGQDVWVTAIVRAPTQAAAATSISLTLDFVDHSGNRVTWVAPGAGTIATPVVGNYYLLSARMTTSTMTPSTVAGAVYVVPGVVMPVSSTAGTYVLRVARAAAVLLDASAPSPAGAFDASVPGFEPDVASLARSYGPCYAVNQVADPDCSSATGWANDSTSGVTVDTAGSVVRWWPSGGLASNVWTIHNPSTTSRTLAIRTSSAAQFIVSAGRRYRAHVRLLVGEAFTAGALQVVWLDGSGAPITTSVAATFDAVGSGATAVDEAISGVVTAPTGALQAYMRIASSAPSTVSGQRLSIQLSQPRFFDVSEYDRDDVEISGSQDPEHGLTTYTPSRSGAGLVLTPSGARRRIPRPFLLRRVRSLWDGKAPESQRNLLYRRDFTMSLRASDPRIYTLDERHETLRATSSLGLVSAPMSAFDGALNAASAVVGSDDFNDATAGGALTGRTAPAGGAWTTSGSTTDFTFRAASDGTPINSPKLGRDVIALETTGRFAVLGTTTYTNVQVEALVSSTGGSQSESGLLARWTDANNHLRLRVTNTSITPGDTVSEAFIIETIVAGSVVQVASSNFTRSGSVAYRYRLAVYADGHVTAQILTPDGAVLGRAHGTSSFLNASGALATGAVGLWDRGKSSTLGANRRYDDFDASTIASPYQVPPNFTYEGQSLGIDGSWRTTSLAAPFPRNGVTLGPLEDFPPKTGYLTQSALARMYYSAGAVTYTTPQVTVAGDCISGEGFDYDLFADSYIGSVWQYNYIGALLKRISSSAWIEARYNSANSVAMNNAHPSTAPPFSLELWCSHTAAGSAGTTRLAAWDVPVSAIIDGRLKQLRTYMDVTGVVYVELWETDPNLNDNGLIARQSFTLSAGLAAVVGPAVAGRSGAIAQLATWDHIDVSGAHLGVSFAEMQRNYNTPYISSFEALDYASALMLIGCPVIGDVDDVPLRVQLRGDIDTPTLTRINLDTGETATLRLTGKFLESDPVTVDMDVGTIRSTSGLDYFDRRLTGSRFFSLAPGLNIITVQAVGWDTTAAAHVIASWRDALH